MIGFIEPTRGSLNIINAVAKMWDSATRLNIVLEDAATVAVFTIMSFNKIPKGGRADLCQPTRVVWDDYRFLVQDELRHCVRSGVRTATKVEDQGRPFIKEVWLKRAEKTFLVCRRRQDGGRRANKRNGQTSPIPVFRHQRSSTSSAQKSGQHGLAAS